MHRAHEGEVHVREHPLPGSARLFQMNLASGWTVSIATEAGSSDRSLSIVSPDADDALATVVCTGQEATTLAALLSGIRFVIQSDTDPQTVDAANLRTLTLPAGSPVVGRTLTEVEVPEPEDARVIAVIRDDTADLIETDAHRACQPGDRLVLVGRPGSMSRLVQYLVG